MCVPKEKTHNNIISKIEEKINIMYTNHLYREVFFIL